MEKNMKAILECSLDTEHPTKVVESLPGTQHSGEWLASSRTARVGNQDAAPKPAFSLLSLPRPL